jgi:uncharacterized protein YecE (DUF72 family)
MANTIPSVWEVTNPALAIVRLHGRNHETWNKKGLTSSVQRFDYDYYDELAELAKKIETISAARVHVVLNNNYEDQGQRNARTLMGFIGRSLYQYRLMRATRAQDCLITNYRLGLGLFSVSNYLCASAVARDFGESARVCLEPLAQ